MSDTFYIEFEHMYEGSELVLESHATPEAAVANWYAKQLASDKLWLLRVRDNTIEYYAEVYAVDSWALLPGVQV